MLRRSFFLMGVYHIQEYERYDQQMEQLKRSLAEAREREELSYDTGMLKSDVKDHIVCLANQEQDEVLIGRDGKYFHCILTGVWYTQ